MADYQSLRKVVLKVFNLASRTFACQCLVPGLSRSLPTYSKLLSKVLELKLETFQSTKYVDSAANATTNCLPIFIAEF